MPLMPLPNTRTFFIFKNPSSILLLDVRILYYAVRIKNLKL